MVNNFFEGVTRQCAISNHFRVGVCDVDEYFQAMGPHKTVASALQGSMLQPCNARSAVLRHRLDNDCMTTLVGLSKRDDVKHAAALRIQSQFWSAEPGGPVPSGSDVARHCLVKEPSYLRDGREKLLMRCAPLWNPMPRGAGTRDVAALLAGHCEWRGRASTQSRSPCRAAAHK